MPELEDVGAEWTWLIRRPHVWRRTPHLKGRRISGSTVWRTMLANEMSAEEMGEDLDLPLAAVIEAVSWCEANADLVAAEALEERRQSERGEPPRGA